MRVRIDFSELKKLKETNLSDSLEISMDKGVKIVEKEIKKNVRGRYLRRRSGLLSASIFSRVYRSATKVMGEVGVAKVPYARIQEFGGTIRPKTKKWLAVPLPGVAPVTSRFPHGEPHGQPKDFPNTFIRKSKTGQLIIFQKEGKRLKALFVLKKSVRIPEKRYIRQSFEDIRERFFKILIGEGVKI